MKNKVRNRTFVFGALLAVSVVLALVLSPLRGDYFNRANFIDKAISISGINHAKIKNARVLTSLISEPTALNVATDTSAKSKVFSAKGIISSKESENHLSKSQKLKNLTSTQRSFISESVTSSGNRRENAASASPNKPSLIASANISKAGSSNNSATSGFTTTTTTGLNNVHSMAAHGQYSSGQAGGPPPDSGNGDNPPTPSPVGNLPVGNGVNFMLILAIAFSAWKARNLIID